MIQQEAFRLATPIPGVLTRKVMKDHLIGNLPISKGATVTTMCFPNQYNPKYFKDPFEFRPERW